MINSFSSQQISKTDSLDSTLTFRQNKLDSVVRFLKIKSFNPKLRQDQIANKLSCSTTILQRYGNVFNLISPYRISLNSHRRRQKLSNANLDDNSNGEHDFKRP